MTPAQNALFKRYRQSAAKRGIGFYLTKEEFLEITSKKCLYCGTEPSQKVFGRHSVYIYNGIDRIMNGCAYDYRNCATCCGDCNRAKGGLSLEKWKEWLRRVSGYVQGSDIDTWGHSYG